MPNRSSSKLNLVATAQVAAPEIRTPRIPYTPPTLPALPNPKSGRDTLSDMEYLWADYHQSYRTAHLLYMPLMETLKIFCPEVDWTKLQQWISHYKHRRRSRDFKSYLRGEDIESFIDYMLKYHPVKDLGDKATVLDEYALERDLAIYFSKWDVILMRERVKREAVRLSQRQSSASLSSVATLAPPITGGSNDALHTISTSSRSPAGSSRPTSTGLVKRSDRFELPEKRRILITKFVDESIDRVTRAMLAIHITMYGENWIATPDEHNDPDGQEQSTLVAIAFQPPTLANGQNSGETSADNTENLINSSTFIESDVTISKLQYNSSATTTPDRDSISPIQNPLSPQEKEAMKQYLATQELFKEYRQERVNAVDGTYSFDPPTSSFRARLADVARRPHSAFCPDTPKVEYVKIANTAEVPHIWQPKPVSPHTQAKLYSMHQYPESSDAYTTSPVLNHQFIYHPTHSHPTQHHSRLGENSGNIMDYVFANGVPIGPETTPHIAMFADQRREREREDRDTMLRHCF